MDNRKKGVRYTIVYNSKHMRDKHYKVMSVRLSEDNIIWLKEKSKDFGSWNRLFNYIIRELDNKKHKKE